MEVMTTLAADLLAILRCPQCKGALRSGAEPLAFLECATCRLRYAIRDGIPIMLIDEATPC